MMSTGGKRKRYPVVRGAAHRLCFRLLSTKLELFVEGMLLDSLEWPSDVLALDSEASLPSHEAYKSGQAPVGEADDLRAWLQFPKATRLFWAWRHCEEDERSAEPLVCAIDKPTMPSTSEQCVARASGKRGVRSPPAEPGWLVDSGHWAARRPWLNWREALELRVASSPAILPEGGGDSVHYLRHSRSLCTNEVKQIFSPWGFDSIAHTSQACEAACSSQKGGCVGFRFDERTFSPQRCVLLRGLRSIEPADCNVQPLAQRQNESLFSLREAVRPVRKPFIEPSSFDAGDSFRMVALRSQLSNVPTKAPAPSSLRHKSTSHAS